MVSNEVLIVIRGEQQSRMRADADSYQNCEKGWALDKKLEQVGQA